MKDDGVTIEINDLTGHNSQPIASFVTIEEIQVMAKKAYNLRADRGEAVGYGLGFEDGFSDGLIYTTSQPERMVDIPFTDYDRKRLKSLKVTSVMYFFCVIALSVSAGLNIEKPIMSNMWIVLVIPAVVYCVVIFTGCRDIGRLETRKRFSKGDYY